MNEPADLLRQLAAIADDVGSVMAPADARQELAAACRTARIALAAESVSVARLDGDELVYEAADGTGAIAIVGLRLPLTRGIASYVVRSGQSLVVEQVEHDPRFARDVAERVGYVPTSMVVTPIVDGRGKSLGVLSVLDRGRDSGDALAVASAVADQVALVLPRVDVAVRLAPLLFQAVAELLDDDHAEVALAVRGAAGDEPDELAELATLLAELRDATPEVRAAAVRIVSELTNFARSARRRR